MPIDYYFIKGNICSFKANLRLGNSNVLNSRHSKICASVEGRKLHRAKITPYTVTLHVDSADSHQPGLLSLLFCLLSLSEETYSFTYPGLNHVDSIGSHQLGTLQDIYNALILGLVQKVV